MYGLDAMLGPQVESEPLAIGQLRANFGRRHSVFAYFEPRYNVSPYLQLYFGVAGESISFPNRAAARSMVTLAFGRPSVRSPSTGIRAGPKS